MPVRRKRALPSIVAGILTPFALLLVSGGLPTAQLLLLPRFLALTVLIAGFGFALAISLWKPISPLLYGLTLVVTFFAIAGVLNVVFGGGNLTGLVVIVVGAYGLLMGVAVAAFGSLLRIKELPRWAPLVLLVVVGAFLLATNAWLWWSHYDHSRRIVRRVDEIRRAELAYAAAQADHAFTCNGPDLPGLNNIEWRANEQMGLQEKNQAYIEDHWVSLSCEVSGHPQWVDIAAGSYWGHNLEVRVTR